MIRLFTKAAWCLLILLLTANLGWAQDRIVTGKVTSLEDGSSLPGVNILAKGTTNGTATDSDGNFKVSVGDNSVLVFSFIGYASQEIAVGTQSSINVTLELDITALSEVIVVGYGTQDKKDLTGSVVAISAKDFNKGVILSPQDLLVGKVAGVQVTSNSGAPGSGSTIRIRGGSSINASNDPLIIIDGFPVDNTGIAGISNPLATINPNDIETFTVLKDASATAIYGLRASNGVIIITTKKSKESKLQLSYNGNYSVGTPAKYYDVLNASEYKSMVTDLQQKGIGGITTASQKYLGNADTNWQKEIYSNAFSHDHNISVAGNTKNVPYRVSYGYTDQQGILKSTGLKRNSLNVNLNPSFLDGKLNVNASFKGSLANSNFGNEGAVGAAIAFDPTQPVYNDNTKYGGYFTWTLPADNLPGGIMNPDGGVNYIATANPVSLINQTSNTAKATRAIGNIQIDYTLPFFPDIRANVNAGFDISHSDGQNNALVDAAWTFRNGTGQLIDYTADNKSKLFDFYLNYKKTIGASKVEATAGYSYQNFTRDGTNFSRNGDGTNIVDGDKTDPANPKPRQFIPNPNTLVSFFGRINYSYRDKYLLTGTLRNDQSSRFAKENRVGIFPSGSIAWKINNESFLAERKSISNLKLRGSYGITGQQDVSGSNPYPFLSVYQQSFSNAQYQFGSQFYNTLRPNPYDANIKWETTSTVDVGLDFGILKDRFTAAIDVYSRETKNLINFIPIAAGSNFSNYLLTNVGSMTNKGVEVTLNAKVIENKDLTWNFGMNFTQNTNKVTKLTKTDDPTYAGIDDGTISGGVGNRVQNFNVGYPANSFFVFQQIYDQQGNPIEGLYVDRSGKGGNVTSNNLNKYHYKSPRPNQLIGVNSRVNYKSIDFSFSGRVSLGNYVYNNVFSERARYSTVYNQSGYFNNVPSAITNSGFVNPQYWSDYYVENASFFKMDFMSAGYSFDNILNQKLKGRVSFTVQNAFIISKYSGNDPEVSSGIDNNIYPRPRTFLLGLNLTY